MINILIMDNGLNGEYNHDQQFINPVD